ncbi:MAG: epoxyqueuosine reductase [Candidatus Binatota bacterium]|nr:epoxyqueuosine reductase [Candidatus Binatota bacterium]
MVESPADTHAALKRDLAEIARRQGFVAMGVAPAVEDREARAITLRRIEDGSFRGLPWFDAARVVRATDPRLVLPGARSVILLAASYAHSAPEIRDRRLRGRVSRYAWGRDYHRVLEKRARPVVARLREAVPGSRQRVMVDHGPLLERAYARAAGLGWQGKNTMLLTRGVGSYTLIASLLTTVVLEPDAPVAQSCGACTRCLPSCPTGALRSPGELVNDLCISYHTIENRGAIPRELRPLVGDWVFGCDLCQEACPVNDGVPAAGLAELDAASADDAFPDLLELLAFSEEEFRRRFAGRPLMRAKYGGMLRNVCVALGNLGDANAVPALERALTHREPLVRGHAAWALGRLGATRPLRSRSAVETDEWVRTEIAAALADGEAAA